VVTTTVQAERSSLDNLLKVVTIVSAALMAEFGVGIVVISLVKGWSVAGVLWGFGVLALAASSATGLLVRSRRPGLSTVLIGVGAIGPSIVMFWLPPVHLASIAMIVLAIVTRPRRQLQT
jgi:hypothetical protein